MESDEGITRLVKDASNEEEELQYFQLLCHRGQNTVPYSAQPDGDTYVDCKTCKTLLYVPFTCGFGVTESRQFSAL